MASKTGAGNDTRMVEPSADKYPIRCAHSMTAVTGGRSRHVCSRFPSRLYPIVAGHTGAGCHPPMLESRAHPADRPMAAITGHGRWNMGGRQAACNALIMALRASSRSDPVMREESRPPIGRPVTAITIDGGRQVV